MLIDVLSYLPSVGAQVPLDVPSGNPIPVRRLDLHDGHEVPDIVHEDVHAPTLPPAGSSEASHRRDRLLCPHVSLCGPSPILLNTLLESAPPVEAAQVVYPFAAALPEASAFKAPRANALALDPRPSVAS